MVCKLTPSQWIARCAARLGERWRTAAVADLEEAAICVWQVEALRNMEPEAAAAVWLAPLAEAGEPPDTMQR